MEIQNEELKRVRLELEDSLKKYFDLYEFAPVGLFTIDIFSRILEVNLTGASLLGMERRILLNKRFEQFVDSADRPIFADLLQKALKIVGKQTCELKILSSGAAAVYLRIEVRATENSTLNERRLQIAAIDITEAKRAEESMLDSEKRFRSLADNIPDLITRFDRNLKLVYANTAVLQRTGLPEVTLMGRTAIEYGSLPKAAADWEKAAREVLELGELRRYEHTNQWQGETRVFDVQIIPEWDTEGVIHGVIAIAHDITERKQAEEALRQSEEKYRTIVEKANEGIWIVDARAYTTYVNKKMADMLGYLPEEMMGKRSSEFMDEEGRAGLKLLLEQRRAGIEESPEIKLIRKDGSPLWTILSIVPLQDKDGIVVGSLGMLTDITGRKLAEETLSQLNEDLEARIEERTSELRVASLYSRRLIEASLDPLVTISPEGKITDVNEATELATGRTREELIGTDFANYFTDPNAAEAGYQKVLAQGHVKDYPLTIRRISGKTMNVLYNAAVYRNERGELQGVFAAARDVTELKKAEAALRGANETLEERVEIRTAQLEAARNEAEDARRRAEWLAKLPEENPNPILRATTEGTVIYGNPTASGLAGWNCQRGQLLPDPFMPLFSLAISKGDRVQQHFELGDKTYSVLVVPIPDKDYANIYGLDITERNRMEDELRKAKEELEQKVRERTAQLQEAKENLEVINKELQLEILEHEKTEKDLMKAKEVAEAATIAKAAFMANMSHEIRTPMNAIIGMTSLLQDEDLTAEQRDFVEVIRSGGDALLSIINQILDFSRLERERIELENQAIHLPSVVEEALDLAAPKAAEKKLNLAYIIDKTTPSTIVGDANRIRQVLINLLDNAVKFTEKGEVVILVSSKISDSISNIHFAVKDTGIGIPQDKMGLLFEPFSQVDYSINKEYGGTGLGLAISKRLVKLMGGDIWLESDVGIGSTFHFNILAKVIPSQSRSESIQPRFKGKRILIVDNNKTNRRILGRQTKDWGLIPTATGSLKEALKLIRSEDDFDIAILEVDNPEIDGLGLGREIRKHKKEMPLIMLTYAGKKAESDIFQAALAKPIKPTQLYNILTNAFSEQFTAEPIKLVKEDAKYGRLKILLAEDNMQSQRVILEMLKRLGFGADLADSGLGVLQALERQRYDLILMDVRMPEMSGLDATRIIRQRWPENKLTIIAITAFGLEGDKEMCLDAGMDDYLSKPIKLKDLQNMLGKYISPPGIEEDTR